MKVVLASNNAKKIAEISQILAPFSIDLLPQVQLNIPESPEPYATFIENALIKARHASRLSGLPALADDSGLCVHALGGAPGVYSARFAGDPKSDERNNTALLDAMATHTDKRAYYYCILVLVRHADDPQPLIADGLWHGEILSSPQGNGGFGYDPLFWLDAQQCTAAQLSATDKNLLSHRGQALQRLLLQIQAGALPVDAL